MCVWHKNSNDPMYRSWDMSKTKIKCFAEIWATQKSNFFLHSIYVVTKTLTDISQNFQVQKNSDLLYISNTTLYSIPPAPPQCFGIWGHEESFIIRNHVLWKRTFTGVICDQFHHNNKKCRKGRIVQVLFAIPA